MRRFLLALFLVALAVTANAEPKKWIRCEEITQSLFEVQRIVDGDTLVVFYDGEATKVRLAGIDAPERGKPGAAEATEALRELTEGKIIRLVFTEERKRDNFGRLLAEIHVDGVNVNEELLRLELVEEYSP